MSTYRRKSTAAQQYQTTTYIIIDMYQVSGTWSVTVRLELYGRQSKPVASYVFRQSGGTLYILVFFHEATMDKPSGFRLNCWADQKRRKIFGIDFAWCGQQKFRCNEWAWGCPPKNSWNKLNYWACSTPVCQNEPLKKNAQERRSKSKTKQVSDAWRTWLIPKALVSTEIVRFAPRRKWNTTAAEFGERIRNEVTTSSAKVYSSSTVYGQRRTNRTRPKRNAVEWVGARGNNDMWFTSCN